MKETNIYFEIIGYIGTALVILSMMMTSVKRLRSVNIGGSIASTVYGMLVGTYPVVLLNVCLMGINIFQLIREAGHKKKFGHLTVDAGDKVLRHFLTYYEKDIEKFFPNYCLTAHRNTEVHMIYIGVEPVCVLAGTRVADSFSIELDYVIPKYRDLSVGKFLFSTLKEEGVEMLTASVGTKEHMSYLKKLGFVDEGGIMLKSL